MKLRWLQQLVDWTATLSRRAGRRRQRRTDARLRHFRPRLERLEERLAPATRMWDAGGDGTTWTQAANWDMDMPPGPSDDAMIGPLFAAATISVSGDVTVRSFNSAAAIQVSGGTFTIGPNVGSPTSEIGNAFTIQSGAAMTLGTNVRVLIRQGRMLTVNGTLSINDADTITIEEDNFASPTAGITINSGGLMTASATIFTRAFNGNDPTEIRVNANGRLVASDCTFGWDQLVLTDNSLLSAGDLTGNTFNLPVSVPALQVPLLDNNVSFNAVILLGTGLPAGQSLALDLLGTTVTPSQHYVFPNNFTVPAGTTLTIGTGVRVLIKQGVMLTVNGTLSINDADTITIEEDNFASPTAGIFVNGIMTATATDFVRAFNGNDVTTIQVSSGGRLTATSCSFAWDNVSFAAQSNVTLRFNRFALPLAISGGAVLITSDNDFGNPVATVTTSGDTNAIIDLRNNYWGVVTAAQIEVKITHDFDNPNLPLVLFEPFLISQPPSTFFMVNLIPSNTGFTADFSRAMNPLLLNLYDFQTGGPRPADVTLVGNTTGPVRGSVVLHPGNTSFTFIRTGGLLAPDTYTVTLRSAADGFRDLSGALLDGNRDGTAGDNLIAMFQIAAAPAAVVVSIPNLARGPAQPVHVPVAGTSIPLRLSNGNSINAIDLTIRYDPALLHITGASLGSSVPAGAQLVFNASTPGVAHLDLDSPMAALPAGAIDFVFLTATVRSDARYRDKHILDLTDILINEGAIISKDDDGLHVVTYLGDASGNAAYSALDSQRILRVVTGLDSGFENYLLVDPLIVADVTGNGQVTSADSVRVLRQGVGINQPVIPPIPPGVVPIISPGPDPFLNIPKTFRARPGATVTVPVNLDLSDGLESADLAISYDRNRLEIVSVSDIQRGSLTADFGLFIADLDNAAGMLRVGLARTAGPISGRGLGSVLQITFRIRENAPNGAAVINLRRDGGGVTTGLNEGGLDLIPDPSNRAGDVLDGLIRVRRAGPAEPQTARQLHSPR